MTQKRSLQNVFLRVILCLFAAKKSGIGLIAGQNKNAGLSPALGN